ncbi:MAG: carbamoyltransferase HypF [Deltaproteobacteria bacterium]|nr:carbamoyltransferase HypF [Deltaproteobacteria bacterium]
MPLENPKNLARISIRGVVQGVGFRPFVYQLALKYNLKGWVCNTSSDVKIEVEGEEGFLDGLLEDLRNLAPPRSRIEDIQWELALPAGYEIFEIRQSVAEAGRYQLISPDIATCPLCERELFDSRDRRWRYPFINCTNCGPRLTIIQDIPYDRPKTTMQAFKMCPSCQREYDDPLNRRFHAQPNCCPQCGPAMEIADRKGNPIKVKEPIAEAAGFLRSGNIIALKGIGGFLLCCDARNEKAVQTLRRRKKRDFKPFAVMVPDMEEARRICFLSREEQALLGSPQAPIVLLKLKQEGCLAPGVCPHLRYLGVMLPYTPIHHLLMRDTGFPLIMTSGNLSEEPIARDNDEALRKLADIADYFLLHNRDIYARCDDSVAMIAGDRLQFLRRARGYAPQPIHLPFRSRQILACGAEIKNTFCMTRDSYAFISQHIGDMENIETLNHFEIMLDLYRKLFRIDPRILAHDMHPDYLATKYAREMEQEFGLRRIPVQHHHAHIVSCAVENGVTSPVLGIALDGTGYGDDGAMWGGEFLLADCTGFRRLAHLEYIPLPGGDAAVRRPYRMALSALVTLFGEDALDPLPAFLREVSQVELDLIKAQIRRGIHSPPTSSMGRLFDSVAAILGICKEIDFEGQAAAELEMLGTDVDCPPETYPYGISEEEGKKIIRLGPLLAGVMEDLASGMPKGVLSAKFHRSIAELIARTCETLSRETGLDRVALSGGVFQNRLLLGRSVEELEKRGLRVLLHREIPCNDGGISLGQAVIAHFRTAEGSFFPEKAST